MKYVFPSYYEKFKCIGSKCKHNCCIGWGIDVDDETYELYKTADSEWNKRFADNIVVENGTAHFVMKGKRCPFLNEHNLCDIITEFGEDALCDICYSHPRFFNEIGERIECGIGLCCVEAARVVLSQKEPFYLECDEQINSETKILKTREKVFEILQNRAKPIDTRIDEMLGFFNLKWQKSILNLVDELLLLERLDEKWTDILQGLKQNYNNINFEEFIAQATDFETEFEQLITYFIYRHFGVAKSKQQENFYILFAVFGYKLIYTLCAEYYTRTNKLDFEDLVEFARLFSSEIEYSQDNFEKVMVKL